MSCGSNTTSNTPSGFPNAPTMAGLATNLSLVWEEICKIQQAILSAASQCQVGGGKMGTIVAGNTPMTFVSGVTSVTVDDGGLGYFQDTPSVKFIPPNGSSASGATATVISNGGSILGITITNGGTGYQPVSSTMSVASVLGAGAVLEPLVNGAGNIVNINIANAGTGYTVNDTVTATRAILPNIAFTDAIFQITSVGVLGEILEVIILNPGTGYQPSVAEVQIVSTLNPLLPYPTGSGFMSTVITDPLGVITEVIVTNAGAGYAILPPYLVISNAGTGAQTSVSLTGTSVSYISVTNPGVEYSLPISGTVFNPSTASLPNPPATPAQVTINIAENTYGTDPNLYWMVWAGATTDRVIQGQLNQVLSYFKALGYAIEIQSNPQTGSTIMWNIAW